jgi:hypothetical protein
MGDTGQCASGTGCDSGVGCGMCGDSGCASSTPFLQLVKNDGSIETLNDVMVTSPSSMFSDPLAGAAALKKNQIGFDIYPVLLKQFGLQNTFDFKLKEIEYETSMIKEMSYTSVEVPENSEVATDDTHQNIYIISKNRQIQSLVSENLLEKDKRVFSNNYNTLNVTDSQPVTDSICLDQGQEVGFTIEKNQNGDTHLAVAAFFHHLHTGGVERYIPYLQSDVTQPTKSYFHRSFFTKGLPAISTLSMLLAAFMPANVALDDESMLRISNSIPTVQADTPHKSLYYYYKNSLGSWTHFSTTHPRYKLAQRSVVKVPNEAFADGKSDVEVKIVSNSKHFIYSVCLVDEVVPLQLDEFTPVAGVMNKTKKHSFENASLATFPGDELSFSVTKRDPKHSHIFFKIQGHYSPLQCKSDNDANHWWSSLTSQEQALFSN